MAIVFPESLPVNASKNQWVRQSFAQNRLWFLYQLAPTSGQHNIVFRLVLNGPVLDEKKLAEVFCRLVWRHSILRTGYKTTEFGSIQELASDPIIPLEVFDFSEPDLASEKSLIEKWLQAEQEKPFDLSSGKVVRPYILKRSNNLQEIIYTIHHIAFDGRSNEIFLTELAELYGEVTMKTEEYSTPATPDYADFSIWERGYMTADVIRPDLDFWREYLQHFPVNIHFKGRNNDSALIKTANHRFFMSTETTDTFKKSAKQYKQTLFNALTSLFNLWVFHISGQKRFLIGTDVHGRDFPAVENIMGFFVNQLIIRCDLSKDLTFKEFLTNTRASIKHSLAHRQIPFDVLVSSLVPERKINRPPFFQVKFNYRPYRFIVDRIGESPLVESHIINGLAGFDVLLDVMEIKSGIEINLQYNQHLFTAKDIERFAHLWLQLITQFDTLIELPVSQISQQLAQLENNYLQTEQLLHNQKNRARLKASSRKALNFN